MECSESSIGQLENVLRQVRILAEKARNLGNEIKERRESKGIARILIESIEEAANYLPYSAEKEKLLKGVKIAKKKLDKIKDLK